MLLLRTVVCDFPSAVTTSAPFFVLPPLLLLLHFPAIPKTGGEKEGAKSQRSRKGHSSQVDGGRGGRRPIFSAANRGRRRVFSCQLAELYFPPERSGGGRGVAFFLFPPPPTTVLLFPPLQSDEVGRRTRARKVDTTTSPS